MFTGIVRNIGTVIKNNGGALQIKSDLKCREADSIAVDGVCLTVSALKPGLTMSFDLSPETLSLTNLGSLSTGARVNLEPALRLGETLGGHLMSGHVDGRGKVLARKNLPDGSTKIIFELPRRLRGLLALKGSVAVDGVSLTVTALGRRSFESVLVPYTLNHTNLGWKKPGTSVNLEADAIARYVKAALNAD